MRIFDETKTNELTSPDLKRGQLMPDKVFVRHHEAIPAVEEKGHVEIIKKYSNGGKDAEWVVDIPAVEAKDAWDEYEDILIYVPYSETELAQFEIDEIKAKLVDTDYQAIKYAEGAISEEEYAATKKKRAEWRQRINELEEVLNANNHN